ncbi:hypothetical protein Pres01_44810 [Metapseudomonas resinovorans]|nr:hypothetical protein Pres01_44810 [Pseudomonas resinovorans]
MGIYHFATSKHTFHTHGTYSFIRKKSDTTLINLWHGMPLKNIGLLDNKSPDDICYSDILVSTSPLFSKILSAAFGVSSEKIFHLGLPRNDVLAASANTDRKLIAEKFSFWEGNKFVAWLPTYRKSVIGDIRQDSKTSSFLDEWEPRILDEINQLAKAREIHLIIKLHPMDSLNREFEYEKFSNIHIFTSNSWEDLNLDLYDFLSVSSGLISDISSVLIDYQLTNRPIGITVNSITEYKRGIIEELNFEENFKSFKISKIDDFDIFFQACKSDINFEQGSVNYNKPIGSSACDSITTLLSIS